MSSEPVSVIGVGRLGLCVALSLERAGYDVVGVDIFPDYVEQINNKTLRSKEPRVEEFLQSSKNFHATTSLAEAANHSDIIFVFVDTPSTGGERYYDVSKLGRVLRQLDDLKVENKHVIIGCTVLPGYVRNIGRHLLRNCKNTTLSYNPEFIQQGDIVQGFLNPDMVLIGAANDDIGAKLEEIYGRVCENKPTISRMSAESAEICKLSINCFITTKISFANMVGDIADSTPGADKLDILKAVGADSRIGLKCLRPGYGFGGPCFPRDNRALGGYASSIGVEPLIPKATDDYNKFHKHAMTQHKLAQGKDVHVFEDVAYKPQCPVPIIEESQKLAVAAELAMAGKKVVIKDRDFILEVVRAEYGSMFEYESL